MTDDPRDDVPRDDVSRDEVSRDDDLAHLLHDAADAVDPGDGLTAIRSRTHTEEKSMSTNRNWLYVTAGVVATAAVIVAVAVLPGLGDDDGSEPAGSSSAGETQEPTESATDSPTTEPTSEAPSPSESDTPPAGDAVAVYFVGEGPRGPVLFREFQQADSGEDVVSAAARLTVAGPALDPDYRTVWPAGTTATASFDGNLVTVDLAGSDLQARPADLSKRLSKLALQQVVYSVQGAAQERAPVLFLVDGQPTDTVLGEPTTEPVTQGKVLSTLSLMSITVPAEGQVVSGSFEASGVNNGFEASVSYEIRDGDQVVASGFGMAEGWMEDKLWPWTLDVDLSGVEPGTYTFVAMNDDPSGGEEGFGPDVDTRTIVVQ